MIESQLLFLQKSKKKDNKNYQHKKILSANNNTKISDKHSAKDIIPMEYVNSG